MKGQGTIVRARLKKKRDNQARANEAASPNHNLKTKSNGETKKYTSFWENIRDGIHIHESATDKQLPVAKSRFSLSYLQNVKLFSPFHFHQITFLMSQF